MICGFKKLQLFLCCLALAILATSCAPQSLTREPAINALELQDYSGTVSDAGEELLLDSGNIFNTYSVKAQFNERSNTVEGYVQMAQNLSYPGEEELHFNLYPNNLQEQLLQISAVYVGGAKIEYKQSKAVLTAVLPEGLLNATGAIWTIHFTLDIPITSGRWGNDTNNILLSNWFPTLAVYQDGVWQTHQQEDVGDDSFNPIAVYQVVLDLPQGYTFVSTGLEEQLTSGDRQTIQAHTGPVREFTCVFGRNLTAWPVVKDNFEITLYGPKDIGEEDVAQFLATIEDAFSFFESTLGLFPFAELDIVTHDLGNLMGMEYSNLFALNTQIATKQLATVGSNVGVHELAHMWFYNVVGNNQFTESWLDEGLVSYLTDRFFWQELSPADVEQKVADKWLTNRNASAPMNPLAYYLTQDDYRASVYRRGSLVFHALERKVGTPNMDSALKQYYKEFAFKEATVTDLINVMHEETNYRLDAFFSAWLYEQEIPFIDNMKDSTPEVLVASIKQMNGQDWSEWWSDWIVEEAEEELNEWEFRYLVPIPEEYEFVSFTDRQYEVGLANSYQTAVIVFDVKLRDSSDTYLPAQIRYKINLDEGRNKLNVDSISTSFSLKEDESISLVRRFANLPLMLIEQDESGVLQLMHPDQVARLEPALLTDINWKREGWQSVVIGKRMEINETESVLSTQLKVVHKRGESQQIVLYNWVFNLESYAEQWYLSDYVLSKL